MRCQAGPREDRQRLLVALLRVLGREHVDRRVDDRDLLRRQQVPHERRSGEDVGVRLAQIGQQELPSLTRTGVLVVRADVTAPDHRRARVVDRRHHAGGLGVVQDDDVPRAHELAELSRAGGQGPFIDGALVGAQPAAVSVDAVEMVVHPFGDVL
jgi:hypothetical protein